MSLFSLLLFSLASSQFSDDDFELDYPPSLDEKAPSISTEIIPEIAKPTFEIEAAMLGFMILFFVNLYVGKQKNEKIAKEWLSLLKPLFQENFSHTGASETEGEGELQ